MSTIFVVQARVGSRRLPRKVLADLGGRPLLAVLLDRLMAGGLEPVIVATTDRPEDDAVADAARTVRAEIVRGAERDVLSRFALALARFPASTVVRITADCPLCDPALVHTALEVRAATGADYVSNTLVRTYPDGLDVEVLTADALHAAATEAIDPIEREHVTPFVYRRPERFALRGFRSDRYLAEHRWTVDTPRDLERVRGFVEALGRADFAWQDVLALDDPTAPVTLDGLVLVPAGPGDADLLLALRNDVEAVRWSRSGRAVTDEEHAAWFARLLECPGSRCWVARDDAGVAGQVRVDVQAGIGAVSITVDPRRRGRGIGRRILEGLLVALGADEQVHTLDAAVHRDNDASRRLFTSTGFREVGGEGEFAIMRRERVGQ